MNYDSDQYITFMIRMNKNVLKSCPFLISTSSESTIKLNLKNPIKFADCALKLIDKKSHFGVFSAEDALFVSNQIVNQVNVIGELKNKDRINEPFSFETVVVVRSNHNGGFGGLRSTNYCHPGFGDGQFWTDRVLKEFESAVVVPRDCKNGSSSTESEISSLADFFKAACRPGMWSFDDMLDKKLKRKFPTLCSLCDSPHRCAYNEDFQGSHREALTCLTDNGGDVTYVALDYVKEHFGLKPNTQPKANPDDYKFLCTDGSYRPLRDPCPWIRQPWPVVVALKENATVLKSSIMNSFLCKRPECRGKWEDAFTLLLEGTSQTFLPVSSKDDNLLKFLSEARTIPEDRERRACKNSAVRLCTINAAEYSKCSWLKRAVISQGIEPRLHCVQSYSLWSCFDLIKKGQADVVGIDSDYTFIAEKNFDLSTVMYQDNNNEFYFLILPIIKADSNIKSLADFKNKRISFPEFNGLAWNSFLSSVKKKSLLPKVCPYVDAVAAFLKSACLPGINDVNHKYFNSTVPENLCSLCSKVNSSSKDECMANSSNKYYGDFGALNLLVENGSDIAIIDYLNLFSKKNEPKFKELDKNNYRIFCKDGTLRQLSEFLEIDRSDCAMSYGLRAELISRSSIKKSERNNIVELFSKMSDRFGERLSSLDNPIMMYRPFNGTVGLIFQEFTVDLVSTHDESNNFISSLVELKTANSEECHEWKSSAASHSDVSKVFLLVLCLYYFFNVQHQCSLLQSRKHYF